MSRRRSDSSAAPCATLALLVSAALSACGGSPRFALRPPLWHDGDDRPFSPAPVENAETNVANAIDVTLTGPLARSARFELAPPEAHNVNAVDEVPDSSWFTNRIPSVAEVAAGPCPDEGPVPPMVVLRSKSVGDTPGFVMEDARGQRYVMKVDGLAAQPEINTAADAIVSRLYWAVGFNVPCNQIVLLPRDALRIVPGRSVETRPVRGARPLTPGRLDAVLRGATRAPDGRLRFVASRFIEGRPLGTWRTEGVRADDLNDVIAHEDRRELRGERLLAAWVAHWDSRGPNTYDSWVSVPPGDEGYVRHYFLDFGDSLGAVPSRDAYPEPRVGHTTVANAPNVLVDMVTLGLVRRPWDELSVDPRFPNLGFFDVAHFSPLDFAPQTPLVRWARAQPADLGWMARRIAGLDPQHVRAAVRSGQLSDPREAHRLTQVLLGRRDAILRAAFGVASPLYDVRVAPPGMLCMADLGVRSGISSSTGIDYEARGRLGVDGHASGALDVVRASRGSLCVRLPRPFAPPSARQDAAERYAVIDITRRENARATTLRAHLYEGGSCGYTLVGLERP